MVQVLEQDLGLAKLIFVYAKFPVPNVFVPTGRLIKARMNASLAQLLGIIAVGLIRFVIDPTGMAQTSENL